MPMRPVAVADLEQGGTIDWVPELPEVEIVCRELAAKVDGRRWAVESVSGVGGRYAGAFSVAPGAVLAGVTRRGKYVLVEFTGPVTDSDGVLVVHLGMSGVVSWGEVPAPADTSAQTHQRFQVVLRHAGASVALTCVDPRGFGGAWWWPQGAPEPARLAGLGPEPVAADFDVDVLRKVLVGRRPVKAALLDQRVVAGVGNIYADEALWAAGVHPLTHAGALSDAELRALAPALRRVLIQGIEAGGTTLRDYRHTDGSSGSNAPRLVAYGRDGSPCVRCGTTLAKGRVAGRGTTWCPTCQHQH